MTPLERAARALCALDGNPADAPMDGKPMWQSYLPEVRAVIAAIREPSVEMGVAWCGNSPGGSSAARDWQAMIDTMLAEDIIKPQR